MSIKPILVTGAHRSGTTWVGKVLETSESIGYIQEPFNVDHPHPGICDAIFEYWFTYINDENGQKYYESLKKTLEFQYKTFSELKSVRSLKNGKDAILNYYKFRTYRKKKLRPLLKDPLAVFSTEWLVKTFDMEPLILIRHPAAFVSSLKRLNWNFDFNHFLKQPLLMRDHLSSFEDEIIRFSRSSYPIIDQAILLWRIIYSVVLKYQRKYNNNWFFIRHEDIAREPLHWFKIIFDKFELEFTEKTKKYIIETTSSSNPSEAPNNATHYLKRDSKSSIWNWRHRLSLKEIDYIKNRVNDISTEFYEENDW